MQAGSGLAVAPVLHGADWMKHPRVTGEAPGPEGNFPIAGLDMCSWSLSHQQHLMPCADKANGQTLAKKLGLLQARPWRWNRSTVVHVDWVKHPRVTGETPGPGNRTTDHEISKTLYKRLPRSPHPSTPFFHDSAWLVHIS